MLAAPFLLAADSGTGSSAPIGLILFIILVALVFDFLNGFHDAANSIATIVSTRVLTPSQAVIWAAFFNFVAAFLFGTKVAGTIGKGLIENGPQYLDVYVVLAGLTGAIVWNILTWLLALPTSSSHALVSAAAGAAVCKGMYSAAAGVPRTTSGGFGAVVLGQPWALLLIFIVLSPLIGMILGSLLMVAMAWIFRRSHPHRVDTTFRRLQLVSAGIYSLGHGGNDAQKTMGIIVLLLGAANLKVWATPDPHSWLEAGFAWLYQKSEGHDWLTWVINLFHHDHSVAWWIILSCHFAISLGTMFGGWRIVKTMGSGITKLQPIGGFCAETAAATTIIAATGLGVPISTTHAITGSIIGVGTTKGVRSVRWIWGQRIVVAWILTIPCSAVIAALTYVVVHLVIEPFFH